VKFPGGVSGIFCLKVSAAIGLGKVLSYGLGNADALGKSWIMGNSFHETMLAARNRGHCFLTSPAA
jgi:hypothetical protein